MNEDFVRVVPTKVRINENLQYILDCCHEEAKARGSELTEREFINVLVQDGFRMAAQELYKNYFAPKENSKLRA